MKDYQLLLTRLFENWAGEAATQMTQLAQAGSDRRYFRIAGPAQTVIGTYNADQRENRAFLTFGKHFHALGLPVPEVYAADESQGLYLQQDLGERALFQYLPADGQAIGAETVRLYERSLEQLARLQILGGRGLDYSVCYPRAAFDRQSMLWDLNYFKHYFLKLAGVVFDEQALEDDFQRLADYLLKADSGHFLFRDFQSRNIMVYEDEPFFIDFQGGRRGALQYDVASLLYQAKGNLPELLRDRLLQHYIDAANEFAPIDRTDFTERYYGFVLIRCLQALGAYGFRGLYERREHFLSSIPYALRQLAELLASKPLPHLPELNRCLHELIASPLFTRFDVERGAKSALTVRVQSFSYRVGMPEDPSDNGGGFVFDCRFLHNPGRYEPYKKLTGLDEPTRQFLKSNSKIEAFLRHTFSIVDMAVENYIERGHEHLMISFGCTGGQHRSVFSAEATAKHLQEKYGVKVVLKHCQQDVWPK